MASVTGRGDSFSGAFRNAFARPSYTAKGAVAQFKHLMKTEAGREALADAGLGAVPQTRRRWVGGRQKPGKANAAAIQSAYETMRRGEIPRAVMTGKMRITGRVGTGSDIRERGTDSHAPLLIDLSRGTWTRVDRLWNSDIIGDAELDDLLSEDLIEPDIGGSDTWFFSGGSYTVKFEY
jgi:hypothetical protein